MFLLWLYYKLVTFLLCIYYTSVILPIKIKFYINSILTFLCYVIIMLLKIIILDKELLIEDMIFCNKRKHIEKPPPGVPISKWVI